MERVSEIKYVIYKITNNINDKIYIGAHATSNINDSYMGSGKHLIRAQSKYGIENFSKEILHIFDNATDMYEKERQIVDKEFILSENTYNLKLGGEGGVSYTVASEETREKMRNAKLGKPRKMKENWVSPLKGKKRPNLFTPEVLEKMRTAKLGRVLSDEHKRKISDAQKGRKMSPESVKKSAMARTGHTRTEEQKAKIKEAIALVPKKECVHCGGLFQPGMYKRWHGDNCKLKGLKNEFYF